MKRAQLAVETLLIYGIAILIVMLAIGALIGFGVLDLGGLLPDKCDITGVAIECTDYLVEENGNVQLQLLNSVGNNIAIDNITIEGEGDSEGLWGSSCFYNADDDPETSYSIGGTNPAYLLVNGENYIFDLVGCNVRIPAGKKISGVITVRYAKVGSDLVRNAYGSIRVKVS